MREREGEIGDWVEGEEDGEIVGVTFIYLLSLFVLHCYCINALSFRTVGALEISHYY